MELISHLAIGASGFFLGLSLRARRRQSAPKVSGSWQREEATIACHPLQVIGGRRGPGGGGGA